MRRSVTCSHIFRYSVCIRSCSSVPLKGIERATHSPPSTLRCTGKRDSHRLGVCVLQNRGWPCGMKLTKQEAVSRLPLWISVWSPPFHLPFHFFRSPGRRLREQVMVFSTAAKPVTQMHSRVSFHFPPSCRRNAATVFHPDLSLFDSMRARQEFALLPLSETWYTHSMSRLAVLALLAFLSLYLVHEALSVPTRIPLTKMKRPRQMMSHGKLIRCSVEHFC